jgi:hypothetical protein
MHSLGERLYNLAPWRQSWLVGHCAGMLRSVMGSTFLIFGALTFFLGISPSVALATRTTTALRFDPPTRHACVVLVGAALVRAAPWVGARVTLARTGVRNTLPRRLPVHAAQPRQARRSRSPSTSASFGQPGGW